VNHEKFGRYAFSGSIGVGDHFARRKRVKQVIAFEVNSVIMSSVAEAVASNVICAEEAVTISSAFTSAINKIAGLDLQKAAEFSAQLDASARSVGIADKG
jgi:hypothetical protein